MPNTQSTGTEMTTIGSLAPADARHGSGGTRPSTAGSGTSAAAAQPSERAYSVGSAVYPEQLVVNNNQQQPTHEQLQLVEETAFGPRGGADAAFRPMLALPPLRHTHKA